MERRLYRLHSISRARVALLAAFLAMGCGGVNSGDDDPIGSVEGSIIPCNQGEASFDVWRADFDRADRMQIAVGVDTRDGTTAAEFRLVVACEGEVLVNTTGGAQCSHTPPSKSGQGEPECPFEVIDIADIPDAPRIECLAEITSTEALDIGVGRCADPAEAKYTLRMVTDDRPLALDLVADDCRDDKSCLEKQFGIDVN
jgi:hypothetical protein